MLAYCYLLWQFHSDVILQLALRNLGRRKRRTLLTVSGIVGAAAIIVFLSAMFDGFVSFVLHQSVETDLGALQLHRRDYFTSDTPLRQTVAPALSVGGDIAALSPRLRFEGMLNNGAEAAPIWLTAFDPMNEYDVCPGRREIESTTLEAAPPNGVLLNEAMAASLGLKVGSEATLLATTQRGRSNAMTVSVFGLIRSRVPLQNKSSGIVKLAFAQRLLEMEGQTEIALALRDVKRIDAVASSLRAKLGETYLVSTWRDLDPVGTTALNQTRAIVFIMILVLYALALLGVANTTTLSVHERVREIGTMLALGMRRQQVLRLFVSEAAALSTMASVVGVLLGVLVSQVTGLSGIAFEQPDSPPIVIRPAYDLVKSLLCITCIVFGAVIAAYYPARRATLARPIDALANR